MTQAPTDSRTKIWQDSRADGNHGNRLGIYGHMATWIEDLAEDARQRVGVTDHPTTNDLLRLVEITGARVEHRPVSSPYCVKTERGSVIVLPLSWRGAEDDEDLCHEVAHSLLYPGAGNLLRFLWPDSPRIERLAKLADARDEAFAERFVRAWFRR